MNSSSISQTSPFSQGWRVTITGADDAVDPAQLSALSEEFPFVEWGILFSKGRAGKPRYPTDVWRAKLYREFFGKTPHALKLSAHLCGALADEVMHGHDLAAPLGLYRRVQINGFLIEESSSMLLEPGVEFILQIRSEEEFVPAVKFARARPEQPFSILFDSSCGKGVAPARWPPAPFGVDFGCAGGINPDNLADVLGDIIASNSFGDRLPWIDMESGVRTDDQFDLAKVRSVLEQVAAVNSRFASR